MTALATPILPLPQAEAFRDVPRRYRTLLRQIRELEVSLTGLDDSQLRTYLNKIRRKIREGESLDRQIAPVFAAVSVASWRTLNMRPYNVQLIGGLELHKGRIAEMATGEGKTLVATLPAVLNAIAGKGVHVVTVNDYLASRDAEILSPLYTLLGLTVGVIISNLSDDTRRAAYRSDIVYGTNKEFGFDYLRDQIKIHSRTRHQPINTLTMLNRGGGAEEPVQRQLNYAIVDEADSILIDESRTPLVIAAPSGPSEMAWAYEWADKLATRLRPRHDFELKLDKRQLTWKDEGRARLEKILVDTNTPSVSGESWQNLVLQALRARWVFTKDQHYVINGDEVVIVDEYTGRRMPGRTWSDGLHQAVQAKEHMLIKTEAPTLARTTYQHYFSLYTKLSGMTGTAATETAEFLKVYKLQVTSIPTHRPKRRTLLPDRIYRTRREKWLGVAEEIKRVTATGRPVLVGTSTIDDSEELSHVLREKHIPHETLNAKPENAHREADIVANAGQLGAVTIATNMAGRGTDIKLGPGVATLGGLHVIGTQRHESRRVDNQLIGRCGRQGDPGSSLFLLSLQDALLQHLLDCKKIAHLRRALRTPYGHPTHTRHFRTLFAHAQLKVERMHYRMRQQLMEYEDWLNKVYHQMGT